MIAYLVGGSLVGLWAEDCLSLSRWVASSQGAERTHWVASGELTVPSLHAAALEPHLVDSIELRQRLRSWTTLIDDPLGGDYMPSTIHAALRSYDLPDLEAMLGDRLTIADDR